MPIPELKVMPLGPAINFLIDSYWSLAALHQRQ